MKTTYRLSLFASIFCISLLSSACDSKQGGDSVKNQPDAPVSKEARRVDAEETRKLFESMKSSEAVKPNGGVAFSGESIFIHPSVNGRTKAVFNVSDANGSQTFKGWIAPLPQGVGEGAGVVEVQLLLDGQSLGKFPVTRNKDMSVTADLSGKSELIVIVDSANGTDAMDWFNLGIEKP